MRLTSAAIVGSTDATASPRVGSLTPAVALAGLGLLVLAVPTFLMIARESWTDEQAQQGPLVLVIGGWMLWRRWPLIRQQGQAGPLGAVLPALLICGSAYIVGRIAALYLVEAYALYAFAIASLYAVSGVRGLRLAAFPLVFLAFSAPIPFAVGWPVTVALRLWISEGTIGVMHLVGVEAARDGLTLYLSNYKVEIEQACSGMNSLLALSALGLCYVHLRRDPPLWYVGLLSPLVVMFAMAANFARVLLLAAVTLVLGDGLAQSALHQVLGFATFAVALCLTFAADTVLAPLIVPAAGERRLEDEPAH